MDKAIYKHDITQTEAKKIPKILRKYNPVEVTLSGKKVYVINDGQPYPLVIVTSNINGKQTIVSMYRETLNPRRITSGLKDSNSQQLDYHSKTTGYTTSDFDFVPAGAELFYSIPQWGGFVNPSAVSGALFPIGEETYWRW